MAVNDAWGGSGDKALLALPSFLGYLFFSFFSPSTFAIEPKVLTMSKVFFTLLFVDLLGGFCASLTIIDFDQ